MGGELGCTLGQALSRERIAKSPCQRSARSPRMRRAEILRCRSVFALRWLRPKKWLCSRDPLGWAGRSLPQRRPATDVAFGPRSLRPAQEGKIVSAPYPHRPCLSRLFREATQLKTIAATVRTAGVLVLRMKIQVLSVDAARDGRPAGTVVADSHRLAVRQIAIARGGDSQEDSLQK